MTRTVALLLFCFVIGSAAYCAAVEFGEAPNANWMLDLQKRAPEIPFNHLLLPGTHNAALYESRECDFLLDYVIGGFFADAEERKAAEIAWCQKLNLVEQLELGIRAFDIRVHCHGSGALRFAHGKCVTKATAEAELQGMASWLNNHSEIAFLKFQLSLSGGANDAQCRSKLKNVLDDFPRKWNGDTTSNWPSLGDLVNGGYKVMMIYDSDSSAPVDYALPKAVYEQTWSQTKSNNIGEVVDKVINLVESWTAAVNSKLVAVNPYITGTEADVINYVLYGEQQGIPRFAAIYGNAILDSVHDALTQARERGVYGNVVLMDYAGFYNDGIMNKLIDYNNYVASSSSPGLSEQCWSNECSNVVNKRQKKKCVRVCVKRRKKAMIRKECKTECSQKREKGCVGRCVRNKA